MILFIISIFLRKNYRIKLTIMHTSLNFLNKYIFANLIAKIDFSSETPLNLMVATGLIMICRYPQLYLREFIGFELKATLGKGI